MKSPPYTSRLDPRASIVVDERARRGDDDARGVAARSSDVLDARRARAGVDGDAWTPTRVRGRLGRWAVGRRARRTRGDGRGDADDERRGRVVVVDGGDAREGVFARGRRGGEACLTSRR